MTDSPVAAAHRLLVEAIDALSAAAESGAATDAELLSALTLCEGVTRRLDRLTLATISTLERRGVFTDRGYKSTAGALSDLLGWERFEARRRVHAASWCARGSGWTAPSCRPGWSPPLRCSRPDRPGCGTSR
jgi:hypothetical protein